MSHSVPINREFSGLNGQILDGMNSPLNQNKFQNIWRMLVLINRVCYFWPCANVVGLDLIVVCSEAEGCGFDPRRAHHFYLTNAVKGRNFPAMNLKRWFAWLCLALMLVAEILLFRANHERDAALTELRAAQHDLRQTQAALDDLQNSTAGLLAAENSRLRKQNEILTNKLATLQASVDRLQAESRQTAQHLATARTALELQQEHLQQLQTDKQRIAAAGAAVVEQNACINNLRQIDAAKQQWALEKNKPDTALPTAQELLPYFKTGTFPVCPAGGTYYINAVGELPACTLPGHALPQ